jgi:hypothetical protein
MKKLILQKKIPTPAKFLNPGDAASPGISGLTRQMEVKGN